MEDMEKEIIALHDVLESRGINSRKTTDIFGRTVRAQSRTRIHLLTAHSAAQSERHASHSSSTSPAHTALNAHAFDRSHPSRSSSFP